MNGKLGLARKRIEIECFIERAIQKKFSIEYNQNIWQNEQN